MFRNPVGGLLYLSFLLFSAFFGFLYLVGPVVPFVFLKPKWFRWTIDKLLGTWLRLPSGILEVLFGMKVFITTENFPPECKNERALIIMNHRTRLDWMYYWSVALRQGDLEKGKIILKDELKHIPGFGWAMQMAMFIFLKRNWEKDEPYLHRILCYFTDNDYPLQLLLFPEGTDYDQHTSSKSRSFAIKNNLPIYKHVLHPRLRGFTYCVEQLRRCERLDSIQDVTVAYRGGLCRSELDLLMGNFPQHVYFHIKRYPIEQIPESPEELEKWCAQKWAEKEEALEAFYENGKFNFDNEEKRDANQEAIARREIVVFTMSWLVFTVTIFVLIYLYSWVRWYGVVLFVLYSVFAIFGNGIEEFQVSIHTLFNNHRDHLNNYSTFSYLDHSFENGSGKPHMT